MPKDYTNIYVSEKRNKLISEDFNERKKKYEEMKELRQMLKERKQAVVVEQKRKRKQQIENKKRKEENDIKSGNYEVIKNPEKMKKWKIKARRLIRKVPKDIFYSKYFNKEA